MECHAPLVLAEGIWLLYIEADPQVVWVYVWSWMQRGTWWGSRVSVGCRSVVEEVDYHNGKAG